MSGGMSSAMRLLQERHIATEVDLATWSNKMDLLALSNVKGEVSLHRLNWQRVWLLPPPLENAKVDAMAWRPDGKVLAVAYNCGDILLVDVENAEQLHTTKIEQSVSCLSWVEESEEKKGNFDVSFASHYKDHSRMFLPTLPSLSRSFGPMNKGTEENAEDSKKIRDQSRFNLLLVGTVHGIVLFSVYGLFPCGRVDMSVRLNTPCRILALDITNDLKEMVILVAQQIPNGNYELTMCLQATPVLAIHAPELQLMAQQYGHILSLLSYMDHTMASITEAWENILMEMDSKLASYALTVPEGSVSADFLDLLMLGVPSDELEMFLLQDLTEKGLKKLGHSIELSYSNIQKLVLKHLQAVGQNILYHLAEVKGMAHCVDTFGSLGLREYSVMAAITASAAFMTKATEVQQVIDSSMKNYKAFFRWLYVAILRLSDERLPPEITKIRQTDLKFIAEFLENFDGMGSKNKGAANTSSGPQRSRFNLERLGQYLMKEDLTITMDTSQNNWHKFLATYPCIAQHPLIFPRFEKMSLVQAHDLLKTAIDDVFLTPERVIFSTFPASRLLPFMQVTNPTNIKVACVTSTADRMSTLAFIDPESNGSYFCLLAFPLTGNEMFTKSIFSRLNFDNQSEDEPDLTHTILDLQFYSDSILSVLLEQNDDRRTPVFVQFPSKTAMEKGNTVSEDVDIKDIGIDCDSARCLEDTTLRPLENMVASRFAVSGSRKVAMVLSESRRRVRLFEMEVEEDEEDEDLMDATNTTKDSDTSQTAEGDVSADLEIPPVPSTSGENVHPMPVDLSVVGLPQETSGAGEAKTSEEAPAMEQSPD